MSDINKIFQQELRTRRKQNIFAPDENCNSADLLEMDKQYHISISIDETNEETLLKAEHDPQQVESLLGLVVDFSLGKRIDDAIDTEVALRHLALHKRGD